MGGVSRGISRIGGEWACTQRCVVVVVVWPARMQLASNQAAMLS